MSKKRYLYFDLLSVVACLAVIFLHCNGIVHWGPQTPHWSQALAVEVGFYWAVPIFFMCTGAKTLDCRDRKSTRQFLTSRLKGIFFPFLAWSMIIFVAKINGMLGAAPEGWSPSLSSFAQAFMGSQIDGTYWFFFAMFGVTMSIPVLSYLRGHKDAMWYLVIVYSVLYGTIVPLTRMLGIPWNDSIAIPVAGGYVMYVILGYLLAKDDGTVVTAKRRKILYVAGIAGLAVRYGYTWIASQQMGAVNTTLFDYNFLTAILPSAALFVFFKNVDWERLSLFKRANVKKAVASLSGLTFGIYLLHNSVLSLFVLLFSLDMSSYFVRLVLPFIIFAVCSAISLLLNKIPVVRGIVGGWR